MKCKVAIVTGARSEYDIISPVLEQLNNDDFFEVGIIVTGSHLSEKFGKTIKFIEEDGYSIIARINNLVENNEKLSRILSLGNEIGPLAKCFDEFMPNIVLVTGDREEAIATTMTAAFMDIPVAHLAGGDIAKDGNIDNSIRYAASKFAHLHFTFLEKHNETLLKLGEDNWRIHYTGNPALDKFVSTKKLSRKELSDLLQFDIVNDKYLLVVYHPIITNFENEEIFAENLMKALTDSGLKCIINSPNSDAGHDSILKVYDKYKSNNKFLFFKNLSRETYVNLMRYAYCMVGNSSSGIIEAPSVKLPVVNTGQRQLGRFHTDNVIFTSMERNEILDGIQYWMSDNNRKILQGIINPYGQGNSAKVIVNLLKQLKCDDKLIHKNITY